MIWRQKGEMVCDTQGHLNTLTNQVSGFLNGLAPGALIYRRTEQAVVNTLSGTKNALIIDVAYANQADADTAWANVTTAQTNAWIIAPSFATYGVLNDDGTFNSLIQRLEW